MEIEILDTGCWKCRTQNCHPELVSGFQNLYEMIRGNPLNPCNPRAIGEDFIRSQIVLGNAPCHSVKDS